MVKYLIVGNKNAIAWTNIFPMYMEKKIWFGYSIINKFIDASGKLADLEGIGRWFTNLEVIKYNPEMELVEYNPETNRKYDTYDAVNTNSIYKIPNFDGVIGVPLGIIDYINKDQFEIVGIMHTGNGKYDQGAPKIDGKAVYIRILIRIKKNIKNT